MRAYAKIGEYREGIEYKAGGSTTTTTTTVQTSTNTAQSHTVAGSDRDLAYQPRRVHSNSPLELARPAAARTTATATITAGERSSSSFSSSSSAPLARSNSSSNPRTTVPKLFVTPVPDHDGTGDYQPLRVRHDYSYKSQSDSSSGFASTYSLPHISRNGSRGGQNGDNTPTITSATTRTRTMNITLDPTAPGSTAGAGAGAGFIGSSLNTGSLSTSSYEGVALGQGNYPPRRGSIMPGLGPEAFSPAFSRLQQGQAGIGSGIGKSEEIEMASLVGEQRRTLVLGSSPNPTLRAGGTALNVLDVAGKLDGSRRLGAARSKEEQAMTKWRQWIIEQPIHPPFDTTSQISPIRSNKSAQFNSPLHPPSPSPSQSPHRSRLSSVRAIPDPAYLNNPDMGPRDSTEQAEPFTFGSPIPNHNANALSTPGPLSGLGLGPGPGPSQPGTVLMEQGSFDADVFNTESVMALRDVELAVDEDILRAVEENGRKNSRKMSSGARLSDMENPFGEMGARLSSRRVRPLVIELIQALGHYIDAVWAVAHALERVERGINGEPRGQGQGQAQGETEEGGHNSNSTIIPCPWASTSGIKPPTPGIAEGSTAALANQDQGQRWTSRMLTAVAEARTNGQLVDPPTERDVRFWEDEVRYSIRDVEDVVGIYKGVGWAFTRARMEGDYGEVERGNVLGRDGEGGNMVRLLGDLEEALWGEAPPRATDLAYELPIDFDPYALYQDDPSNHPVPALDHRTSDAPSSSSTPAPATGTPQLTVPPPPTIGTAPIGSSTPATTNSISSVPPAQAPVAAPNSNSNPGATAKAGGWDAVLNLDAFRTDGEEVSLEELGRRRHQEWLMSQRSWGDTA